MASATCYRSSNGTIASLGETPLCTNFISKNGFAPCCFGDDVCLEGNICHRIDPLPGSTGYYVALCNDKNFQDPSCSFDCTSYGKGDIVWSESENTWLCCGTDSSGNPNCINPTTEKLNVLPQSILSTATVSTSTTTATSSATSSGTISTSSAISSTGSSASTATSASTADASQETSSSGLSTGAKAGIGVGVAVGALIILAFLAWLFMRKSRRNHSHPESLNEIKHQYMAEVSPNHPPAPAYSPGEMDTYPDSNGYSAHGVRLSSQKIMSPTSELDTAAPGRHSHIHEMGP